MERMKGVLPAGGGLLTALCTVGAVKLLLQYRNFKNEKKQYEKLMPRIHRHEGSNGLSIERFGDYVVRQMGLDGDTPAAKRLAKLAEDYLRGDKTNSDHSLENVFDFLIRVCPQTTDNEIQALNEDLIKELDICMLSYFSFHWEHTAKIIDQVINGGSIRKRSLKSAVLTATRKQRFQRVMKDLKTQRWFANVLEMMKAMGKHNGASTPDEGTVVVPAHSSVRSPVLLLIGGGMGAGKSTVVKEIMQGPFWKSVASEAVVVEADAFKETDVIYRALSSIGHGENISEAAELVHESSTNAASSLLVTALNEGRDVILDGTMSWEPFVLQTIAMARDVHNKHYRMGRGYGKNSDGTVFEEYWEPVEDCSALEGAHEDTESTGNGEVPNCEQESELRNPQPVAERKPYRIEFVGVVCDAHMAVVRGMRRAIITKRGVPVRGQLRSHKLFMTSLERYCELVDHVKIYSTSGMDREAELIGYKNGVHKLLKACDDFKRLEDLISLNIDATSVLQLYSGGRTKTTQKWHDILLAPERHARQQLLTQTLEKSAPLSRELSDGELSPSGGNGSPTFSSSLSRLQSTNSTDSMDSSRSNDNASGGPGAGTSRE